MSQISLYLDQKTYASVKAAAQAAGVSVSRWVAALIEARTAQQWPASVKAMAGSWRDEPTERPGTDKDTAREPL
jgi:hypothetical protein